MTPVDEDNLPEDFGISIRAENSTALVLVRGEVDVATAPLLRDELHRLLDPDHPLEPGPPSRLVLDLSEMSFIDSVGLGVLIGVLKRARESGRELELRNLQPAARKVFEITGLHEVFTISS